MHRCISRDIACVAVFAIVNDAPRRSSRRAVRSHTAGQELRAAALVLTLGGTGLAGGVAGGDAGARRGAAGVVRVSTATRRIDRLERE